MHVINSSPSSTTNPSSPGPVYLSREQTERLKHVLDRSIPICSSPPSSSPTLNITPRHFLRQVLCKLKEHSIDITGVRLNGGAASYVLVNESNFVYRDIDILFLIKTPLSSEQKTSLLPSTHLSYPCDVWTLIKHIVCSCLLEHISNATSSEQPFPAPKQYTHHYFSSVLETYAKKIIKISSEQDSWALLSLQNFSGQNLELKFVEHLKRQWQFSVDSFQINLEPLLYEKISNHASHLCKCPSISSITKTIRTKSLVIDAINGLTIIKKEHDDDSTSETKLQQEKLALALTSSSPLQFGFFTPSSSPDALHHENNIECQTLATITTIATSTSSNAAAVVESRSRLSKASVSTLNDESNPTPALQFHLSLNDDTDDGIVSDADDSATEDDDQVFRTPVNANSAPPSPGTIIAMETPTASPLLIEVHSVYKDLQQALEHLNKKLIATYAPESMRGGGLLKYCDLLAQNYKVHDVTDMLRMQRYMCSRFFIDYKTIPEQMHVITQYVSTHFLPLSITSTVQPNETFGTRRTSQPSQTLNSKTSYAQTQEQNNMINARLCLLFFDHLLTVIQTSTVCLTHHDKEVTWMSINQLKESYHYTYEHLFIGDNYHYQRYHAYSHPNQYHHHQHHHCSSSSSNSSRSSSPSSSSSNSYRYYRHQGNSNSHRHQNHFQYRQQHPNRPGNNNNNNNASSHYASRNYSNDFNSNQTSLINPNQHARRHQS